MPQGLGPRFLIEAGFIIAVAVVAGVERFRTLVIVILMVVAWLVVAAVELVLAFGRRRTAAPPEAAKPKEVVAVVDRAPTGEPEPAVRVLRAEREPAPEPIVMPGPSTEPEPETAPEEPPAPEPPKPAPEQPRVLAVAPPPPEPEPEPELEPEPAPTLVSLRSRMTEPREWNLWDLERLTREQTSDDAARNEERSYLLMYLREFANADGVLPVDFDGIVRESFGDLLDVAYSS